PESHNTSLPATRRTKLSLSLWVWLPLPAIPLGTAKNSNSADLCLNMPIPDFGRTPTAEAERGFTLRPARETRDVPVRPYHAASSPSPEPSQKSRWPSPSKRGTLSEFLSVSGQRIICCRSSTSS